MAFEGAAGVALAELEIFDGLFLVWGELGGALMEFVGGGSGGGAGIFAGLPAGEFSFGGFEDVTGTGHGDSFRY